MDPVLRVLPFLFYWLMAFLLWSVVAGVPLTTASVIAGVKLPISPPRYLIVAVVLVAVSTEFGFLFFAPFFFFWVYRLARASRMPAAAPAPSPAGPEGAPPEPPAPPPSRLLRLAVRVNRTFLVAVVLLVPVGYLRAWLQLHHPEVIDRVMRALYVSI